MFDVFRKDLKEHLEKPASRKTKIFDLLLRFLTTGLLVYLIVVDLGTYAQIYASGCGVSTGHAHNSANITINGSLMCKIVCP